MTRGKEKITQRQNKCSNGIHLGPNTLWNTIWICASFHDIWHDTLMWIGTPFNQLYKRMPGSRRSRNMCV